MHLKYKRKKYLRTQKINKEVCLDKLNRKKVLRTVF